MEITVRTAGETVEPVTDREAVRAHVVGLNMLRTIYVRHKDQFKWRESAIVRLLPRRNHPVRQPRLDCAGEPLRLGGRGKSGRLRRS